MEPRPPDEAVPPTSVVENLPPAEVPAPVPPALAPGAFFGGLKHKTIYRVVLGYAAGAWLTLQVCSVVLPGLDAPRWMMHTVIVLALAGFGVALLTGWALDRRAAGKTLLPATLGTLYPRAYWQGVVARWEGDKPRARDAFTAARAEVVKTLAAQPDLAIAVSLLGIIDAGLGRKTQAIEEGRRACALMPVSKDCIDGNAIAVNLAQTLAWSGEKKAAVEQLAAAAKLPKSPGLWVAQATSHLGRPARRQKLRGVRGLARAEARVLKIFPGSINPRRASTRAAPAGPAGDGRAPALHRPSANPRQSSRDNQRADPRRGFARPPRCESDPLCRRTTRAPPRCR